ncbi:MAG: ArsR family transcriptional regulator [Thermoprotei archaeon]|nr:MAG: ArsR family transcriptional regulator [Thermoprotei archaeon]
MSLRTKRDMIVKGAEWIERVCAALANPTRLKILHILKDKEMSLEELSELLNQSKANISTQLRRLEEVGLIECRYEKVKGIRKICKLAVQELKIILE